MNIPETPLYPQNLVKLLREPTGGYYRHHAAKEIERLVECQDKWREEVQSLRARVVVLQDEHDRLLANSEELVKRSSRRMKKIQQELF